MVKDKVKEIYENLSVNKYPHVKRVVAYATQISKSLGLEKDDLELIQISAFLHDIGYKKVFEENIEDKHEIYSGEMCEEILVKEGYPKEKIEKIKETISTHGIFEDCKTKFQKILFDADKLDKTNMGELIRKSIIMHEKFKMNDIEIFERLMFKMNNRKFHFGVSKEIADKNKELLFKSFNHHKEFLKFADETEKNFNI